MQLSEVIERGNPENGMGGKFPCKRQRHHQTGKPEPVGGPVRKRRKNVGFPEENVRKKKVFNVRTGRQPQW